MSRLRLVSGAALAAATLLLATTPAWAGTGGVGW
jgi:hypothetical protein